MLWILPKQGVLLTRLLLDVLRKVAEQSPKALTCTMFQRLSLRQQSPRSPPAF